MKTHLLMLVALVAVVALAVAPPTLACNGCGGYGYGYGLGYLYSSLDYNVPYFAAHPPVYYSYPVPRTYGYSPFAYPPHVMTPEIVGEPQPLEITNPHVPSTQQKPADASTDRTARTKVQPGPMVIDNPFVGPSRSVAQQ